MFAFLCTGKTCVYHVLTSVFAYTLYNITNELNQKNETRSLENDKITTFTITRNDRIRLSAHNFSVKKFQKYVRSNPN